MSLQEILETFGTFTSNEKISFIYEKLKSLEPEYQLRLLLATIQDESTSPTVIAAALKFLPKTGYQKRELIQKFLSDPHPVVSRAAKRALHEQSILSKKKLQKPQPKQPKKESRYEKERKLKTLKETAKINESWVPKVLLDDLEDSDEEMRTVIIDALAQRENVNLNTIHQKLLDSPWYVKSSLLQILAVKKNPSSVPYIKEILKNPNSDVRKTAAQTLGDIGGDEAKTLLIKLTRDPNSYVKKAAKQALEKVSSIKFM
jgi:HEAT repeat protein